MKKECDTGKYVSLRVTVSAYKRIKPVDEPALIKKEELSWQI